MDWDDIEHIRHLRREVEELKTELLPSGTGHIHTTITVLQGRIQELEAEFYGSLISDEKSA